MTNSMSKEMDQLVKEMTDHFKVIETTVVMKNQVAFDVTNQDVIGGLVYLKNQGWRQLSILTCVDWIEVGEFQLVYILMNWDLGIRIQLRTRIARENPSFSTITHVYPGAKYYEREVHEFFGVVFEGNEEAKKQLFLENWDDLPPLRKDFDSRVYSDRKYKKKKYNKDFSKKAGEEA